ncbi:Uncharacterized protein AC511_3010 [Pseudomonas coronafaciens pv. oryzae]|nr:Uncharacterized protein AC511_3010 [Pseudomonas coronafaciens pv. oryzae]
MVNVVLKTAPTPVSGARRALHALIADVRGNTHCNATLIIDLTDEQTCSGCDTGATGNDNSESSATRRPENARIRSWLYPYS